QPDYHHELALTYRNLGVMLDPLRGRSREAALHYPGRTGEAAKALGQAVDIYERLVAKWPKAPRYRKELATSRGILGGSLRDAGRYPEAEKIFHQALTVQRQLVDEFPARPGYRRDLAITLNNLAI